MTETLVQKKKEVNACALFFKNPEMHDILVEVLTYTPRDIRNLMTTGDKEAMNSVAHSAPHIIQIGPSVLPMFGKQLRRLRIANIPGDFVRVSGDGSYENPLVISTPSSFSLGIHTLPRPWILSLRSLKELDLSGNHMACFPSEIASLDKLESLDLSHNRVREIESSHLSGLTSLTSLKLNSNKCLFSLNGIWLLNNLRSLIINDNNLSTLPKNIEKIPTLTELYCGNNPLQQSELVPLRDMSNLNILDMTTCRLGDLPAGVSSLTNLIDLNFGGNVVESLPNNFDSFTNLQTLLLPVQLLRGEFPMELLSLTALQSLQIMGPRKFQPIVLPDCLTQLVNLTSLRINYCQVPNMINFARFKKLTSLNLGMNSLRQVSLLHLAHIKHIELGNNRSLRSNQPSSLLDLVLAFLSFRTPKTETISFSGCKNLHHFPPELLKFGKTLTCLMMIDTSIKTLPAHIGLLVNLRTLFLRQCDVDALPPDFAKLTSLQHLDMAANNLKNIDPICSLCNLSILDLSMNDLASLPPQFGNLAKLRDLNLDNCCFAEFPRTLLSSTSLTRLFMRHNLLESLPKELSLMSQLRVADFEGNHDPSIPPELDPLVDKQILFLGVLAIRKIIV